MKKRKIITAALAMTLSAATATTGIVSNPQVYDTGSGKYNGKEIG